MGWRLLPEARMRGACTGMALTPPPHSCRWGTLAQTAQRCPGCHACRCSAPAKTPARSWSVSQAGRHKGRCHYVHNINHSATATLRHLAITFNALLAQGQAAALGKHSREPLHSQGMQAARRMAVQAKQCSKATIVCSPRQSWAALSVHSWHRRRTYG
jgi:hypothetical protein